MKIIITESHYKQILENLIDEAEPSEHFKGRSFGRILNREFFEVGYDEGGFNYITVGTVKKNDVVEFDYNEIINQFSKLDLPTPYMGSLGEHMESPKTYKNYKEWIENENKNIKGDIINLYKLVERGKLSENKFNFEIKNMLNKSYGIKIENLRIPIKNIEINEDYIEYFKEYELDSFINYDLESEIRSQMKNELPKDLKGVKLNDDKVNERVNRELKKIIKDFLYSKAKRNQLLIVDNENSTYGNQTYLLIRDNLLITIFLGIGYAFRNPIKKLKVDYYFDSIEAFEQYYKQNF